MKRRERLEIGSNWQAGEHHASPFVFTSNYEWRRTWMDYAGSLTVSSLNWELCFPEFDFVNDSQWESAKSLYLVWANTATGSISLWRSQWQADTGLPGFQLILTFNPHLVFLLSHQLLWTVSCSRLANRLLRADPYRRSPHRGHTLTDLTTSSSFCLLQGVDMSGFCGVPSYPSESRSLKKMLTSPAHSTVM